jgi:predicted ArsR family transcriptional regulator
LAGSIVEALRNPGPHTAAGLAEALPGFPPEAIAEALESLAAQGVLERGLTDNGVSTYRYVAPERYAQANLDVVKDPAARFNGRSHRGKAG